MLNIKNIIALNIVAFVTLACVLLVQTQKQKMVCNNECSSSLQMSGGTNFSIVNILSLKFR